MIKTLLLVPVRRNDGGAFPRSDWEELEARCRAFGGFSMTPNVYGQWVDDRGRVYRDRSRAYTLSLSSWMQIPLWLDLVAWVQDRFGQEAIYVEVNGAPEILDLRAPS